MISLGHNCATAIALRKINTTQPSLPFDFIGNHNADSLWNVFQILDQLKQNKLDIQKFVDVDQKILNKNRFHLSHFYKQKDIKYTVDKDEREHTVLQLFTRRFTRLQNIIFSEPNLLIYNYNKKFKEDMDLMIKVSHKIIDLNPLNYLLILKPGKYHQINSNIELIRAKRSSKKAIKANLSHYLSKKPEEWIKYYSS
jgi:hypothetical protein